MLRQKSWPHTNKKCAKFFRADCGVVLARNEAACERGEIKMPSGLEFSANPAIIGMMSMSFWK